MRTENVSSAIKIYLSAIIITCIFILIPMESSAFFTTLNDRDYSRIKPFSQEVSLDANSRLVVVRINVDGPYPNGPQGYNFIAIRKQQKNSDNILTTEVLTKLLKGQYHLIGIETSSNALYALKYGKIDNAFKILSVLIFSPEKDEPMQIGPEGQYQYASVSPEGEYILLVDKEIKTMSLHTGEIEVIKTNLNLTGNEASPTKDDSSASGTGNANISGSFIEMLWEGSGGGKLSILNTKNGRISSVNIDF